MDWIGFSPGLLGPEPVRLRILARGGGWFACEKPSGFATHNHTRAEGFPVMEEALQVQMECGKPELLALTGPHARSIESALYLDPEIYGLAIFSWDPSTTAILRNAIGSQLCRFRFDLVARDTSPERGETRHCRLPIREHATGIPPVSISHRRGKKAETRFGRMEIPGFESLELWEGVATWLRPYQMRIHAYESGLHLPGDPFWGGRPAICRESFYRGRSAPRTPLWEGPALRLAAVEAGDPGDTRLPPDFPSTISVPPPRKWRVLLKRIRREPGDGKRLYRTP